MDGRELFRPRPQASTHRHHGPQPTVYWDLPGLVVAMSSMMVLFVCVAVGFLGYKVFYTELEEDEDCEEEAFAEL